MSGKKGSAQQSKSKDNDYKERFTKCKADLTKANKNIESLKTELQHVRFELTSIQNNFDFEKIRPLLPASQDNDGLQAGLCAKLTKDNTDLKQENERIKQSEKGKLTAEIRQLKEEILKLEGKHQTNGNQGDEDGESHTKTDEKQQDEYSNKENQGLGETDAMRKKLKEFEEETDAMRKKLKEFEGETDAMRKKLKEFEGKTTPANNVIINNTIVVNSQGKEQTEVKKQLGESNKFHEDIASKQNEKLKLEKQINEGKETIERQHDDSNKLQEDIASKQKEKQKLERDISQGKETLKQQERELNNMKDEHKQLKNTYEKLKDQMTLEKQKHEEVKNRQGRPMTGNSKERKLEEDMENLKNMHARESTKLKEENTMLMKSCEDLNVKWNAENEENKRLKDEVERLKIKLKELETKLTTEKQKNESLESQISRPKSGNSKESKLTEENKDLRTRHLNEIKKMKEEHESKNKKLKKELEESEEEKNRLLNDINKMKEEHESKNKKLKKELEEVKEENNRLKTRQQSQPSAGSSKERELEEEIEKLKTRLSKMAGAQLMTNNPNIADLSDANRPTKLAEQYTELYDNEWTNAFEVFEDVGHSEKDTIHILYDILMEVYKFCQNMSAEQSKHLKLVVTTVPPINQKAVAQSDDMIIPTKLRLLRDLRKAFAPDIIEEMFKQYKKQNSPKHVDKTAVKEYVHKCVSLCWYMTVQDPPVILDTKKHTGSFNGDLFRTYTKTGKSMAFIVWPPLYLHDGGPMLCKGVAQGE